MDQGVPKLETLGNAVPEELDRKATSLLERVCDAGLRLATAESCTGGLLASILTDVSGCSHAFDRGFVVYTDDAKHSLLGVPLTALVTHSAVSEPVARAMAEGALASSEAHICVAITGYADDFGGVGKAGLVHFALATRSFPTIHVRKEFGDLGRGRVRIACLCTALDMIESFLDERTSRALRASPHPRSPAS